MKTSLAAIGLALALAGPALAQDAKAISEQKQEEWRQSYEKGDAAALTSWYTKDAVLAFIGMPMPVVGEAGIRKWFDSDLPHRLTNVSITATDVTALDANTIIDAGTWAGDVPGQNGGAATHVTGDFIVTMVHRESGWLLRTHAANMLPPSPPK